MAGNNQLERGERFESQFRECFQKTGTYKEITPVPALLCKSSGASAGGYEEQGNRGRSFSIEVGFGSASGGMGAWKCWSWMPRVRWAPNLLSLAICVQVNSGTSRESKY